MTEADLPPVAAFLADKARPGEAVLPGALPLEARLRWVLLQNPARRADIPLGWLLRDAGRIVGAMVCVPFRFASATCECIALMASKYYVEEGYRGLGIGIFMRYLHLGNRYVLLGTTANETSGSLYARCGGHAIAGTDHTMLGIARGAPVVEEWLFRRFGSRGTARAGGVLGHFIPGRLRRGRGMPGELVPIPSADRLSILPGFSPAAHALAVVRDTQYLRWRYFEGDQGRDVFSFTLDEEPARLVVVERVRSGYRGQIRVLNVLDVWPATTARSAPALAVQLGRRYRGQFDALWLRSQPQEAEAALRDAGFVRHNFPAVLGWCIDRKRQCPGASWYLMPGESE